jgi:hypothetical protein
LHDLVPLFHTASKQDIKGPKCNIELYTKLDIVTEIPDEWLVTNLPISSNYDITHEMLGNKYLPFGLSQLSNVDETVCLSQLSHFDEKCCSSQFSNVDDALGLSQLPNVGFEDIVRNERYLENITLPVSGNHDAYLTASFKSIRSLAEALDLTGQAKLMEAIRKLIESFDVELEKQLGDVDKFNQGKVISCCLPSSRKYKTHGTKYHDY